MRKIIIFLLVMTSVLLSACSIPAKTPNISEAATSKLVNPKTSKPILPSKNFSPNDQAVYFSVKITDFPPGTKLKALWRHIDSGTEMASEISTEGTGYEVFTLKRNAHPFPSGRYEVTATFTADGKTLELKSDFSVVRDTGPPRLSDPVTSKSIDNEGKLNPVDAATIFSQSDAVIYFVIKSTDLPKDTKVYCQWIHVDSDESLSHEIVTDGSRNIVFTLKSGDSQKLPEGRYIATASAYINNRAESIWVEFEVRK